MYVVDVLPGAVTTTEKSSFGISVNVEATPLWATAPWMVMVAPAVEVAAVTETG